MRKAQRLADLENKSLAASMINDTDWQHEICRKINERDINDTEELNRVLAHSIIQDPGFLSTTYEKNGIDIFRESGGAEIKILAPKGFDNGLFVESISPFKTEAEYLINAGQKLKIVHAEFKILDQIEGTKNLIIHVIPVQD